jgi:hypothetical protein
LQKVLHQVLLLLLYLVYRQSCLQSGPSGEPPAAADPESDLQWQSGLCLCLQQDSSSSSSNTGDPWKLQQT